MEKKISIIIPVYNTASLLDRCIASVCGQTYKNLEIILIDDGSTDNSYEVCRKWAEKDDRIILRHKENGGQSTARNLALDIATGDYIGFVDSDDWIELDMYKTMLDAIENTNSDVAQCKIGEEQWGEESMFFQLLRDDIGSQLMKFLFAAKLWNEVRLPIGRYAEDATVIPTLLYNRKLILVDRTFYHYYLNNPVSSSNSPSKKFKNAIDRAVMFCDRYHWIKEKKIDEKSQSIVLCKAVSFVIGTMGIYGKEYETVYYDDVASLLTFLRQNQR